MRPAQIFIGYDSKEPVAYHVLAHSILRRASIPVSIAPLALGQLGGLYTRPRGPLESTEFSLTRFLVPYLSGYVGHSLFLDCDMLCLVDIAELFTLVEAQPFLAVSVCPHEYTPKGDVKFLNQPQTAYPRKNWSSLMLFDNKACQQLTPDYVNTATGLELHRFAWCPDNRIGALGLEWNYLVDEENQAMAPPKLLHYTRGGPWFPAYQTCSYADLWFTELALMMGRG